MPTASTTTSGRAAKRSASKTTKSRRASGARSQDAIALLKADHRAVEKLFGQFEKAAGEARKAQLAQKICMELRVHSRIEEELLYPQSRDFLQDDEIVNEAIVEHRAAKDLIEQIESMDASDEMFDAKVTVLQEMIQHHVEEEEKAYFPQLRKSEMDLKVVGEAMKARKQALMAQMEGHAPATH